jgi:hypothetical protein
VDYQTRSVELWRRPKGDGPEAQPPTARPAPRSAAEGSGEPAPPEIPLKGFVSEATLVATVSGDELFDFLSRPTLTLIDPDMPIDDRDEPLEYGVVLKTDVRHSGTVSNLAEISPLRPPPVPINVTTAMAEGVIRITWTMPAVEAPASPDTPESGEAESRDPKDAAVPSAPRVNVYRSVAGDPLPADPAEGSPFASPPYEDKDVSPGVAHRYIVRSVITADGRTVESDAAGEVVVVYEDRYPPAVPRGLRLIPDGRRMNLVWNPSEERDLGGYHVYRRIAAGPWERLDVAPIPSATFTDDNSPAGQFVEYAVTAHDEATPPNESEQSPPVRATVEDR